MLSDLKKGFQVHTLDTNEVPKYAIGKVVAVSEPRYMPPSPGNYAPMQGRVVDLTVEVDGETKTYTVPESQNVAKAMGITLSTGIEAVMNELNAIKRNSQEILDSVGFNKKKIEVCISKRIGLKARFNSNWYKIIPLTNSNSKSLKSNDSVEAIIQQFIYYNCLKNERLSA